VVKMGTRRLMVLIAILAAFLALPFQCQTGQEAFYGKRASRLFFLADQYWTAERRARAKGEIEQARKFRAHAERIEQQAWIYRQASRHHWECR
jgi:hypothetical protein